MDDKNVEVMSEDNYFQVYKIKGRVGLVPQASKK